MAAKPIQQIGAAFGWQLVDSTTPLDAAANIFTITVVEADTQITQLEDVDGNSYLDDFNIAGKLLQPTMTPITLALKGIYFDKVAVSSGVVLAHQKTR